LACLEQHAWSELVERGLGGFYGFSRISKVYFERNQEAR